MFLLRRRATTTTMLAAAGIEDAAGINLSGTSDRRRRTDQVPSDKRPRPKQARRLSENEKARISIYLQILNIVVAALTATLYALKDQSAILFETIRTKGLNDLLYLVGFSYFFSLYNFLPQCSQPQQLTYILLSDRCRDCYCYTSNSIICALRNCTFTSDSRLGGYWLLADCVNTHNLP